MQLFALALLWTNTHRTHLRGAALRWPIIPFHCACYNSTWVRLAMAPDAGSINVCWINTRMFSFNSNLNRRRWLSKHTRDVCSERLCVSLCCGSNECTSIYIYCMLCFFFASTRSTFDAYVIAWRFQVAAAGELIHEIARAHACGLVCRRAWGAIWTRVGRWYWTWYRLLF